MNTAENSTSPTKEAVDTSLIFSKKTLQDYEVISVIGNGTFGTCFKVRDKDNGQIYAWKGIDYEELKETQKESLMSEINVLRQLQHPNIVQYFHHLVNCEAKSIFIVMECCEGGDLAQLIVKAKEQNKRFEECYIWRVLLQICRALRVCHKAIKQDTILHCDIKPANIFLDTEGNVKLGDFGLARILRRNETLADTFVGTPYYMSPETIKSSKYDHKSDVWAVGCLIYEICCLQPPFDGKEFDQLSANILMGKFNSIPELYSKDLQEIIAYMLSIENEQRPSIEVISRHPLLVRNIIELDNGFPVLVDIESLNEFNIPRKLECSPFQDFSSTMFTEQNSFNEGYGQRRLSITGIFTPDLKAELFYSAKRKIFPVNAKLQFSDPELYESIIPKDSVESFAIKQDERKWNNSRFTNLSQPYKVTRNEFNCTFQKRLEAIRGQESLLRQWEADLNAREQQLNEKEKRLVAFEDSLISKRKLFKEEKACPNGTHVRPTIPPKNTTSKHDDTYCSIESNDNSLLHQPTIAKLNMAALPAPKAFPKLRKVTFLSPKKFFTYRIENRKQQSSARTGNITQIHSSTSSKSSEASSVSAATSTSSSAGTTKRKSILSIFGLSRNNKETTNSSSSSTSVQTVPATTIAVRKTFKEQKLQDLHKQEDRINSKCETAEVTNIWTKEQKKAAFEMLAAINAAENSNNGYLSNEPLHKMRQSVRDRNSLQRARHRRSLIVPTRLANCHRNGQIII